MARLSFSQPLGLQKLLQLCLSLVLTAVLVNAAGIRQWAERLEIGHPFVPRQVLVDVSSAWEGMLEPTGLNGLRKAALAYREAWAEPQKTDLAAVRSAPDPVASPTSSPTAPASIAPTSTAAKAADPQPPLAPPSGVQPDAGNKSVAVKPDPALPGVAVGLTPQTHIALVGDSMMAVGLAPNLGKMIERNGLGKVVRAYKSGTGLARPDVFNWMTEYPKMLAGKTPAIVVCAIGANDGQGIQVDKKPLQFGTPAWEEEYAKRVGQFLELLLKDNAKVYWVLLPRMRSPVFDRRTQSMNAFLQAQFKHVNNLVFISPDALMAGGPVNGYMEYAITDGKKSERLRGEDGIHLSDSGARRLAAGLLQAIQ